MICDWCGYAHARTALCMKRPTWGRRGFLALAGLGTIGLALDPIGARPVFEATVAPLGSTGYYRVSYCFNGASWGEIMAAPGNPISYFLTKAVCAPSRS